MYARLRSVDATAGTVIWRERCQSKCADVEALARNLRTMKHDQKFTTNDHAAGEDGGSQESCQ
jgi:hypothetical protein